MLCVCVCFSLPGSDGGARQEAEQASSQITGGQGIFILCLYRMAGLALVCVHVCICCLCLHICVYVSHVCACNVCMQVLAEEKSRSIDV